MMPSILVGGIMRYFKRESYLEKIRGFYPDDGMIKVITGVRRCGKSCLMRTIEEELREGGVPAERIAFFDLDRYGFRSVKTADQLERLIEPMLEVEGLKYLLSMKCRTSRASRRSSTSYAPRAVQDQERLGLHPRARLCHQQLRRNDSTSVPGMPRARGPAFAMPL